MHAYILYIPVSFLFNTLARKTRARIERDKVCELAAKTPIKALTWRIVRMCVQNFTSRAGYTTVCIYAEEMLDAVAVIPLFTLTMLPATSRCMTIHKKYYKQMKEG